MYDLLVSPCVKGLIKAFLEVISLRTVGGGKFGSQKKLTKTLFYFRLKEDLHKATGALHKMIFMDDISQIKIIYILESLIVI